MAWLAHQPRLTQCYVATAAALNACGVKPNGAEIRQEMLEQLNLVTPPVSQFEIQMVLAGMLREGVKFWGEPDSRERFARNPVFAGLSLGE